MELARSEYIEQQENIIAFGPSGTGKTHIALGFVPLSKTGAELLFELISQRYERGSIVATNRFQLPLDYFWSNAAATSIAAAFFASRAGFLQWPKCAVTIDPSFNKRSCLASSAGFFAPAFFASAST